MHTGRQVVHAPDFVLLAHSQLQVNELEERRRNATTITFRHNPLPQPPEPIPLENLPFFANRQRNLDEMNEDSSHWNLGAPDNGILLSDLPPTNSVDTLLPLRSSPESTSMPPTQQHLPAQNQNIPDRRNAIIPGASPNRRFIPTIPTHGLELEPGPTSTWTAMHGHVDPFALAEDYFTEYAEGYQEGYLMNSLPAQPPSRHSPQETQPNETRSQSRSPVQVPPTESRASSRSSRHTSASNRTRRPLGLEDFYRVPVAASALNSRENRDDASVSTVPLPPSTHNASSSSITDVVPFIPPAPHQLASHNAALRPTATPVHAASSSYLIPQLSPPTTYATGSHLPTPPASAPAATSPFTRYIAETSSQTARGSDASRTRARNLSSQPVPPQSGTFTPSSQDSSLRRRSAFSAASVPVQPGVSNVLEMHTPASRISRNSWGTVDTLPRSDASLSVHSATLQLPPADNRLSWSSWGTVEQSDSPRPAPFIAAYNIHSVRDLGLSRTLDMFDNGSNNSGMSSQRSSMLSDVAPFSSPQINHEGGTHTENHRNDALNTPRILPRSLESATSSEISLPLSTSSRNMDWNASSTTQSNRRNRDNNQHHMTAAPPSAAPESRYRAATESNRSSVHSHSSRSSVASPPRASRLSTSDLSPVPSVANALGLDILSSREPYISAPTPVTPSRSILHAFSGGNRQ
ncbi:hypothetical protein H0H92_013205 [Tricholoma furcatifolium]|nr:hypothetical protein H0H92_013205 [Tricholoma furcatifolium]